MKKNSEEYCQIFVVSFLKKLQLLCPNTFEFWHTPNGGGRSKAQGGQMKLQGVLAGVYDIIIIGKDRRIVFVENKKEKGMLSPEQKKFGATLDDFGFVKKTVYADTPHDMVAAYAEIMKEYFNLPEDHINSSYHSSLARLSKD